MKNFALTALAAFLVTACASSTMPGLIEIGPIMLPSNNSFSETEAKLRAALTDRDLKLFQVVDHGQGAKTVGQDIGQSKLFIFGNPKSGTPLMMENRLAAFELPMKVLIFQDEAGDVWVANSDVKAMAQDYQITGNDEVVSKISNTLRDIRFSIAN